MTIFIAGVPYIAIVHSNRTFATVVNIYRHAHVHRVGFRIDARQRLALAVEHPHTVHPNSDAITRLFIPRKARLPHVAHRISAPYFIVLGHRYPARTKPNRQPVRIAADWYLFD